MFKFDIVKGLGLLFMTMLLAACSGGGALSESGGGSSGGGGTTTTVADILLSGMQLIPLNQTVTLTVATVDSNGAPVGNAPLAISVSGSATLGNVPGSTSINGQTTFTISNKIAENVTLKIGSGNLTVSYAVYFGASVAVSLQGDNLPADGTSAANLLVKAQDGKGLALEDIPVQIALTGFAVATTASGTTDASGIFTTEITDTMNETVTVTPVVGGYTAQSRTLTFVASSLTKPNRVDLLILNNSVLADGSATATLRVIARDSANIPIKGVSVNLISDSGTAQFAALNGDTGDQAFFETTVRNTVAGAVSVKALAGGVYSDTQTVTFVTQGTSASVVKSISMTASPSGVSANGKDQVIFTVTATDQDGKPAVGAAISLALVGGSATLSPANGVTDSNGRFYSSLTNTVAQTVYLKVTAGTLVEVSPGITFSAASGQQQAVSSVTLTVANNNQPADGKGEVNLIVVARDASNTPLSNVDVTLSSTSGAAQFTAASGKTTNGGSFTTTVKSTVAGSFTVTASAGGKQDSKQVTFTDTSSTVATVLATVTDNGQLANGTSAATLTVIARDAQNRPVAGAPVSLIFNANTQGQASRAVPDKATGTTDAGGAFTAKITDTYAETFDVVASVSGTASNAVSLTFRASSSTAPPAKIDASADIETAPADGKTIVTVTVVARDASNTPLKDVEIKLSSDSGSALIDPATGTTGANGAFTAKVTNTQAGPVTITASPLSGSPSDTVNITFTTLPSTTPASVAVNLANNGAVADGTAKVTLTAVVRDANGTPIKDTQVTLTSTSLTALFDQATGASGKTTAGGTFTTSMTSTKAESFNVTASAGGISGSAVVTFVEATTQKPEQMELLASSTQLESEGNAEGVVITALVTTTGNNPFSGATINFSATSGVIQAIQVPGSTVAAGVTNESGVAMARLTTGANPANRTITVTATTSGVQPKTIDIQVSGTEITVSGPETLPTNAKGTFTVFLRDSAGRGVSNKPLSVSLENATSNGSAQVSLTTDANGQASLEATTSTQAGTGRLTIAWQEGNVSAVHTFSILQDDLAVQVVDSQGNPLVDPTSGTAYTLENLPDTPLGEQRYFKVTWTSGQLVNLSSSRGTLSTGQLAISPLVGGTFYVSATDAGQATITVTGMTGSNNSVPGPAVQLTFDFVSTKAVNLDIQASPASIGVNTTGSEAEQSQIIAVVRDDKGNLVKNSRVEFNLNDISGGKIMPSFAYTDRNGRASIAYISGSASSGSEGVTITAIAASPVLSGRVPDSSVAGPKSVKITVAQKSVFITLGTGNTIEEPTVTQYALPYTVYVNDINGVAVAGVSVQLAVVPQLYYKGEHIWDELGAKAWIVGEGVWENNTFKITQRGPKYTCASEDLTFQLDINKQEFVNNGILDSGEDLDTNGRLDPGNVAVVPATVVTDQNGFATFTVTYAQQYAHWVYVELTARTVVSGTEGRQSNSFRLPGVYTDYTNQQIAPPGAISPFGMIPAGLGTNCTQHY